MRFKFSQSLEWKMFFFLLFFFYFWIKEHQIQCKETNVNVKKQHWIILHASTLTVALCLSARYQSVAVRYKVR